VKLTSWLYPVADVITGLYFVYELVISLHPDIAVFRDHRFRNKRSGKQKPIRIARAAVS
jgi:hypothetical protein